MLTDRKFRDPQEATETMEFTESEATFPVPSLAVILISPEEMHYYVHCGEKAVLGCNVAAVSLHGLETDMTEINR